MLKINEILLEPSKIYEGSTFLLKVKVQKEKKTFVDLKKLKCSVIKNVQCENLKEA